MGGGSGGGSNTTVQKADPWIGVQPYLKDAYEQLSQLYAPGQGPQYYQGQQVASQSPYTQLGYNALYGGAGAMQNIAQSANNSLGQQTAAAQGGVNGGLGQAQNAAQQLTALGNSGIITGGTQGVQDAMSGLGNNASSLYTQGMSGATNAINGLQAAGDFQNNPAYQQALQSAIRPVTQQFNEQVLPGIGAGAQDAGQFGGSRQGIAQGIASRGYMDTVGDISANMGNAAYAQGLQAQANAGSLASGLVGQGMSGLSNQGQLGMGLAGQGYGALQSAGQLGQNMYGTGLTGLGQSTALAGGVQQMQGMPGQALMGIGADQQAYNQQNIDAQMNQWNYNQNRPYSMMSDYLSMLNGAQGGQTSSSMSNGGGSRMTGALGGAASGAAMGSMFGPMGMGIGAAAGGLYGLFM